MWVNLLIQFLSFTAQTVQANCNSFSGIRGERRGEEMVVKNEYLSPCGMYCSVCSVRAAHQNNDQKLKGQLAFFFHTSPENIACEGCMSEKTFENMVKTCSIRACAQKKGLTGCHQCNDFPCNNVKNFPMEPARNRILEAVPRWKELGTERYVAEVEKHYTCSKCGTLLHRYATECSKCQTPTVF